MTAMIGSYFCFGNLMSPLLQPFGLSVQQLAIAGGMSSFVGIFGMVGGGIFIDKTKMFRKTLIFLAIAAVVTLFLFTTYTLPNFYINGTFVFVVINVAFIGLFLLPSLPICMTFSAEVTYPMQASLSNGICQFASAFGSSIMSLVGSRMLSTDVSQGISTETIEKQQKSSN